MNAREIADRMESGEKLRWIPNEMTGFSGHPLDRRLFLGGQVLTGEEEVTVSVSSLFGGEYEDEDGIIELSLTF